MKTKTDNLFSLGGDVSPGRFFAAFRVVGADSIPAGGKIALFFVRQGIFGVAFARFEISRHG